VPTTSFPKEGIEWKLQVIQSNGGIQEGVHPRLKGTKFDRKNFGHPADDNRWMVDFDALHPGYKVDDSGLSPIICIPGGELFTLCRTVPLNHTKGGKDLGEFGAMADITGVDITLKPGERLALSTSDGKNIIDPLQYKPGTTRYIGFLNLPANDELRQHSKMLGEQVRMSSLSDRVASTHFQNYYLVIQQPYSERYDFQLKGTPAPCPKLPGIAWLVTKTNSSPPPYYCGTGGGSQ